MSQLLKRRFFEQIKFMLGAEPSKPAEIAPAAQAIHFHKKGNRDLIAEKLHARAHAEHKNTWRNRRWATLIVANLLFVLSFALDVQILEGALTASRFVGFPLIDLNSALQVMLAHKHIIDKLLIGTGTVLVLWALMYLPGVAPLWVLALLVFEVFFSRRAWCRYACPIGLTYGVVGIISPVRIKYKLAECFHEGDCRKVCLVPHVLDTVIKGRAVETEVPLGHDCTRCGLCVETCPTGSLSFEIKGLSKLG